MIDCKIFFVFFLVKIYFQLLYNNYQSRIRTQKKKDLQTEINGVAPLKRSRTKMVFNFKSYKAIRDVLK